MDADLKAAVPETQHQQQQLHHRSCCRPSTGKRQHRVFCAAGLSLLLAAAIAVAVAVPVAAAARPSSTLEDADSNTAARQLAATQRAATRQAASQQAAEPACNGVPGLCKVPVRMVTFPGTHNSNAIKTNFPTLAQHQSLTFAEQLKAGGRLFDLDYAGGRFGVKFGHCMSCLCAFSEIEAENDPNKVFKTMADFLAANPREGIVIGLSNINCGDKAAARQELLGALAKSPLLNYLAVQAVGPNTRLGELINSNQRAVVVFYDQWVTPNGYTIGGKFVPNQALWRIYGGDASVDAQDPATIDKQVSSSLLADVVKQIAAPQPALSPSTPWRVMGLFPSSCMVCRATGVCGPVSCAEKANSESFIMFILGKATSRWTRSRGDQSQLVPAFNGFQIDYLHPTPRANVVTAAQKLNQAIAWMYTAQAAAAPRLGFGNCVWVMDDTTATGGLACASAANQRVSSVLGLPANAAPAVAAAGRRLQQDVPGAGTASKRSVLVPANPALRLRIFAGGKLRKEVRGTAGKAQLLDLSTTATELQVSWV